MDKPHSTFVFPPAMIGLVLLGWACLAWRVLAESPSEEQRIADAMASRAVGSRILYDDQGHVVKLALSRHREGATDDGDSLPPGVGDADFTEILKLKRLEAVFLEKMPLSDSSYARLGQLEQLRDVRIHYPTQAKPLPHTSPYTATDRFAQFINRLPNLRILQLKHIFGMSGDGMVGLRPQPELEHLEIDTVCAKSSAVPFVVAAKQLRNLQVHRCEWTDAELQQVLVALPKLEVLELKPKRVSQDPIGVHSLRGLIHCRQLQLLQLVGDWVDIPYEHGLDYLAQLPALEQVNLLLPGITIDSEVVQRLHRARPEVLIRAAGEAVGGKPGQKSRGVDDGYDWGGKVTTHG
jgi:hypothetical protein